jgi:hypothetical protein
MTDPYRPYEWLDLYYEEESMAEAPSERILTLIRKLQAKAVGAEKIGSIAEAEAFAAKVQELLIQHKLEMSDVELDKQDNEDPIAVTFVDQQAFGIGFKRVRVGWQEQLAYVIAKANFCGSLVHPKSNFIWFVGREADREVATFVYGRLVPQMKYQSDWDYGQHFRQAIREGSDVTELRGFKASWLAGAIAAIKQRLDQNLDEHTGDPRVQALVLNAEAAVEEFLRGYGKTPTPRGRDAMNVWGALAGIDFGGKANLTANAINGESPAAVPRALPTGG